MHLYLILCYFFIVPGVHSGNVTSSNNSSSNITVNSAHKDTNSSNKLIPSEGGTLNLSQPIPINLQTLEDEIAKPNNKSTVHARKGVPLTPITELENNSVKSSKETVKNDDTKKEMNGLPQSKSMPTSKPKTKPISEQLISTKPPKKPHILSYEALSNADIINNEMKIPAMNPSSKTMASSQIPSPNEGSIVRVYPARANSHPGMIMPIVITILVVPMFAIIGYMALKRGQEAWKNRHYKRMDFLLDGMYND